VLVNQEKIAWLAPGLGFSKPGGLRYMEPLYRAFVLKFPHTTFYTTHTVHPIYRLQFDIVSLTQFKIINFKNHHQGYYSRNIQLLPMRLVFFLFKHRPHIVISNAFNAWTILCVILKPLLRIRIIVLWDGSSPSVDIRDGRVLTIIRKIISKRVDSFLTNTRVGQEYLLNFLAAKNVVKWPYQVPDVTVLLSNKQNIKLINACRPRFLYVGQLIPQKGLDLLLKSWAKVHNEIQGSLIIVGSGNEEKELKEQALKEELFDVHFIGHIEYNSLGCYYQGCDVFIFPSLEDIWGMVVLEAMAFNLPILCSKYAGSSELVINGENGFVFDPYDLDLLSKLIKTMACKSEIRIAFGKRSKEIIENYSIETAVNTISDTIQVLSQS